MHGDIYVAAGENVADVLQL